MIKNIIFDLGNVIINYNQNKIINNFTHKTFYMSGIKNNL